MVDGSDPDSTFRESPGGELDQISFYLGRVYYTYIGVLDRVLAELGLDSHLRPGMGNVLFALFERDDCTISEIAERLQLSKSTMTTMVARIRKAGLITTRRDPHDGRAVRLKLTPLARSLEPRCRGVSERVDQILCRRFSRRQRDQLRELLAAMLQSMGEDLDRGEATPAPQTLGTSTVSRPRRSR